jgi:hypothetical protein
VAELPVTRAKLLGLIADLEDAARLRRKRVQSLVRDGATDVQIGRCEAALGFALPDDYLRQLRGWNGCKIEIYEHSPESGREYQCALFEILDTTGIAAATGIVIDSLVEGAANSNQAAVVRASLSGNFVVKYLDDYAALVGSVTGSKDVALGVRGVNINLVHENFPPELPQIARSVDEYLHRSLEHLKETLETDLYWH